jgi:hypothetical protein
MRNSGFIVALLLMCGVAVFAQSALEGSWQGDKTLGDVHIGVDGTGEITFLHDPQLTMAVTVERQGDTYIVSQAEPNRDAFYTSLFEPAVARVLTDEMRPMVWEFTLSKNGERLVGTKYTSYVYVERSKGPEPQILSVDVDNDYERPAEWVRLSGRVRAPEIASTSATNEPPITVTMRTSTPRSKILYTLNGDPPTRETATPYSGPVRINQTTTIRAIAVREGWQDSALAEASFVERPESGDGMSIHTPRVVTLGDRQEWYHVNDVNFTSMYYVADVEANTLYELRIWDKDDEPERYSAIYHVIEIYRDQDKEETQRFQSHARNDHEFYSNEAGRVYIEVRNRYYAGFGEMAMRLRRK